MGFIDLTNGTAHDLTTGNFVFTFDPEQTRGATKMEIECRFDSMAAGNDNTACTVVKSLDSAFGSNDAEADIVDTAATLTYANASDGTGDNIVLRGTANEDNGYRWVRLTVTPVGATAGDTVEVFVNFT